MDNRIPKIIHLIYNSKLTATEHLMLNLKNQIMLFMPDYELRIWDHENYEQIQFSELLMKFGKIVQHGVQKSDLLRLDVIYEFGGIYLDNDFIIHKRFDDILIVDFLISPENGYILPNSVFGARKGDYRIKCLKQYLMKKGIDPELPPNLSTGPGIMGLIESQIPVLLPRKTFFPFMFDEAFEQPYGNTFATHDWSKGGSWKEGVVQKKSKKSTFYKIFKSGGWILVESRLFGMVIAKILIYLTSRLTSVVLLSNEEIIIFRNNKTFKLRQKEILNCVEIDLKIKI